MSDNASAGATPAVAGATPAQTPPGEPATATTPPATPPATGDGDLGDAGKRAIAAERKAAQDAIKRAEAAERERDELKAATQSDSEKAIAQAKKDGAAEVTTRYQAAIRRSEVKASLAAAGIQASELDLAALAPEFGGLKVDDEGAVAGVPEAVEAFKAAHPSLFGKPAPAGGTADGGVKGTSAGRVYTRQEVADPAFFAKNEADIMAAMAEGRIRKN